MEDTGPQNRALGNVATAAGIVVGMMGYGVPSGLLSLVGLGLGLTK